MYCRQCGTLNADTALVCTNCAAPMRDLPPPLPAPALPPPLPSQSSGVESIIPYKNAPALTSYYCGVFSVLPFIGIILGIIAVIFGCQGLARARRQPQVKGRVHAWVGIVLGGFFALLYLGLLLFFIYLRFQAHGD